MYSKLTLNGDAYFRISFHKVSYKIKKCHASSNAKEMTTTTANDVGRVLDSYPAYKLTMSRWAPPSCNIRALKNFNL